MFPMLYEVDGHILDVSIDGYRFANVGTSACVQQGLSHGGS